MKMKISVILKSKPLYLILLPIFFVLHGYTENYSIIPYKDALILLFFYYVIALIFLFFFWLIFKNFQKASLITFILLCYQFFFGAIHDFLKSYLPNSIIIKYSFIIPISIFILFLIIWRLKKLKKLFFRTTYFLNSIFILFILVDSIWLFTKINTKIKPTNILYKGFINCDTCKKPDIYLIVADGYPGEKELTDIFKYDNSVFENQLIKKGFRIIKNTKSNYNFTPFSISSMLNMDYLEGLEGSNTSKKDMSLCYETIKKNKTLKFLLNQGYEFYNYSIFNFEGQPTLAYPTFLPMKTKPITSQTFTNRIISDLSYHLITTFKFESSIKRRKNLDLTNNNLFYSLTQKIVAKNNKKPKFIYTHLIMPHYPYYYDSQENLISYKLLTEDYIFNKKAFIEYLKYANKKYEELISNILSLSKDPPIIIFMGDHGFREFKDSVNSNYYFMNFNSVYLPNGNYKAFYDGQSNVNQFRNLLNLQFNQNLSLLKDSTSFLNE